MTKTKKISCGCVISYHSGGHLAGINWCKEHGYFYDRIWEVVEDQVLCKYSLPTLESLNGQYPVKRKSVMSNDAQKIINLLLAQPEVDDVLALLKDAPAMELGDGRLLLPLNIYLKPPAPEGGTLGLHVEDGIGVEDVFGGK